MPRKKAVKRDRKLLLRKGIKEREKPDRRTTPKINFNKRWVAGLSHPAKGEPRDTYRDSATPCLFLRVTANVKTFFWEKTIRGVQKKVTIGRFPEINVVQARAKAADISADYVKDKDVQAERRLKRGEGTFGDLWSDYREKRPRRKRNGPYSKTLDEQWDRVLMRWENKKLSELTHDIVYSMIDKMRDRAPVYANRVQRHGQAMYNFARRNRGWLYRGDNPFEFDYESEEGRARKVRLKAKDMPAFMAGLDACSTSMRLLFLTSLYTGRRIGEVASMRWVDLDLETDIWCIPITKVGESQDAVLPIAIIDLLTDRQTEADDEWVFPSPSKTGHVQEIKKAWAIVRKASGLHEL